MRSLLLLVLLFHGMAITTLASANQITPPDEDWFLKLQKDTGKLKAAWLNTFDPFSYTRKDYIDAGLNVFLKDEDPSTMDAIPVVAYEINYIKFKEWKETAPIDSIMELSKTRTTLLISTKRDIKCFVNLELNKEFWQAYKWGLFDKKIASVISSIYYGNNKKLINLYIEIRPSGKNRYKDYLLYKEGNNYKSVYYQGEKSLLMNDLIALHKQYFPE